MNCLFTRVRVWAAFFPSPSARALQDSAIVADSLAGCFANGIRYASSTIGGTTMCVDRRHASAHVTPRTTLRTLECSMNVWNTLRNVHVLHANSGWVLAYTCSAQAIAPLPQADATGDGHRAHRLAGHHAAW